MKKKIRYAEDDGDMLEIVSEFMQFEDYDVITDNGKSIRQENHRYRLPDHHLAFDRYRLKFFPVFYFLC